jgi:hypothetical protein
MSMPPGALRSVSGAGTPPLKAALGNSAASWEDGARSEVSSPDPPRRPEDFRTQSADRVSITGFGSGGLNERWRNKGRSRVQIVTGSLYLQAGRWADSIRELVEGATVARSVNDHLWHGKALELILVNLILLGWAGLEFQVPSILLPPQEKDKSAEKGDGIEIRDHTQPRWLRNLQVILPELVERILGLYSRISAEHLPPLPLAEATVRLGRVLTAVHVCDGLLAEKSLKIMVEGPESEGKRVLSSSPRFTIKPTRQEIVSVLMRAFPAGGGELLTTVDRVVILSGIARTLGELGFHRKKAMVVRELVSVLIGGLVEARTRGAAEVGIHPAAGLMGVGGEGKALQLGEGDVESGIDAFLGLLLKTYGVVTFDVLSDLVPGGRDEDGEVLGRVGRQSAARHFGIRNVKLNILRACVNFSEALPDFGGVLRFSSDLLRTAGSGIAPGTRREDASPVILKEEQVRLVTNIVKTSNLARRVGMQGMSAEYWDEFLVRGVKLEPLPASRRPVAHAGSVLPKVEGERASQDVNPFIYNPFLKKEVAGEEDSVLVAGEAASFRLTLQNPYEMEVDVESVRLDAEGVDFESSVTSAILGSYRTQVVRLTGTAKSAGTLKITGAIIRVKGCRERRFPIFKEAWSPEDELKVKVIGLGALERHCDSTPASLPKPDSLELSVVSPQPVVVVQGSTLPQSSVMILEGERQVFSVTLQNLSRTTAVDFILFSFQNSTQEALRQAMSNRDATAAELYEYELILAKKQALRLRKGPEGKDKKRYIPPGGTATWEFEILGRPGLTHGLIQIDYAYLGGTGEIGEKFYTRQVELELTVTVNASVEVARIDVLPLPGVIPEPLWRRTGHKGEETLKEDEYCLLMLDLRNSWPGHMLVQLEVEDGAIIEEPILPGHTSRVVVPLKRIYLEDPHAFIPALNPSRQRQYVVSTKISPEVERANREAFWYREKILGSIKGTWKSMSGGRGPRMGQIELRSMRLTGRMIDALKVDDIDIDMWVEEAGSGKETKAKGNTIIVDQFAQLRVRVTNRTDRPIYPLLRLAPALCHRPLLNSALDLTRKFAWNGTLQRTLRVIQGRLSVDEVIGVTALCRGEFEIGASVEETRLWVEDGEKKKGRPRSDTQSMMDAALGPKERRTWVCRRPVRVVVRDRE